jgi:hypothetical protein
MSLTSYQAAPPRDPSNDAHLTGDVGDAQALIFDDLFSGLNLSAGEGRFGAARRKLTQVHG